MPANLCREDGCSLTLKPLEYCYSVWRFLYHHGMTTSAILHSQSVICYIKDLQPRHSPMIWCRRLESTMRVGLNWRIQMCQVSRPHRNTKHNDVRCMVLKMVVLTIILCTDSCSPQSIIPTCLLLDRSCVIQAYDHYINIVSNSVCSTYQCT